jgi:rRNA maturation protein Nop10
MREECPSCGGMTITAHPPKFSLEWEKKFGKYKQKFKLEESKSV